MINRGHTGATAPPPTKLIGDVTNVTSVTIFTIVTKLFSHYII